MILIIEWLKFLSKILLGLRVYKVVECFKGLYCFKEFKELAAFTEFTEVLEAYRFYRVFRIAFQTGYIEDWSYALLTSKS